MKGLNIDIFSIVIFLGLVQGLFMSVLLISKYGMENKILGLILLVISIQISDFFAAYSLISLKYPHLIDISVPLGLVIGPLIYLFYHFLSEKKYPGRMFLHLIPFIVFLLNQSFYYMQSPDFKFNSFVVSRGLKLPFRDNAVTYLSDPLQLRNLGGLLTAISLTIYIILAIRELFRIIKKSRMAIHNIEGASLLWMRNFLVLTMLLVLFVVLNQIFGSDPGSEYIVATGLTIIVYYSGFHFIRNSFLMHESFTGTKYEKSSLPGDMKKIIRERMIAHMINDKPYMSNLFSLSMLSKNVSASPNHVSRIINEDFRQSYFELISSYRIHEACKILLDTASKNRTMEEISFLVGYNSKTAFNKAFKKITGITPLHFKKNPEMYSPIGKHLKTFK